MGNNYLNSFKAGDVVQYASGGPEMTVSEVDVMGSWVSCAWFLRDGELRREQFNPVSLTTVRPVAINPSLEFPRLDLTFKLKLMDAALKFASNPSDFLVKYSTLFSLAENSIRVGARAFLSDQFFAQTEDQSPKSSTPLSHHAPPGQAADQAPC